MAPVDPSDLGAVQRAAAVRAAIDKVTDVITAAGLTPDDFVAVLAEHDQTGFALAESRHAADALAAWLVPAVQRLDRAYIRRLTPEERDELPASFVAGLGLE